MPPTSLDYTEARRSSCRHVDVSVILMRGQLTDVNVAASRYGHYSVFSAPPV